MGESRKAPSGRSAKNKTLGNEPDADLREKKYISKKGERGNSKAQVRSPPKKEKSQVSLQGGKQKRRSHQIREIGK